MGKLRFARSHPKELKKFDDAHIFKGDMTCPKSVFFTALKPAKQK
jgi:hypothetical protein